MWTLHYLLSGHTCRLLLLLHYRPLAVLYFRRESPFFPLFYLSGPLSSYRRLPRIQLLNRSSTTGISCFLWHYPRLTRTSRSVKEHRESGGSTILFFFCFEAGLSFVWVLWAKHNSTTSQKFPLLIRVKTELQLPLCFLQCCKTWSYCAILQQWDQ